MPITDELKSINKLEEAGFSHEQAKAIVEIQEDAIQRGFDRFAEVLEQKFDLFEHKLNELEARMRADMQTLRADMQTLRADLLKEQRDQMLKFAALVSLIAVVTGAVVKLL